MAAPDHEDDRDSAGSILRELIMNQYQAVLAAGATLASVLTLNPMPFLLWLGSELVLLPILDSGPLRRLVARRRRERAREEARNRRRKIISGFNPEFGRRYAALESLCRQIEANYQGLHGISRAYLSEQRGKLDLILDSCVQRMTALQRYERSQVKRRPDHIEEEIAELEQELEGASLNERARAAITKNLELKRRLLASYAEAEGTMKALDTELDSMAALLEVLHQNSLSMRDPAAISEELDTIVKQSEDSGRVVREMETLLRQGVADWEVEDPLAAAGLDAPAKTSATERSPERPRGRERGR
jgi:DNA repair exonuclease SbcCD ATPase subunit